MRGRSLKRDNQRAPPALMEGYTKKSEIRGSSQTVKAGWTVTTTSKKKKKTDGQSLEKGKKKENRLFNPSLKKTQKDC